MTIPCSALRQSTARGGGPPRRIKQQLGSGLSPCPENALPRLLPRDSATRRMVTRQPTAPPSAGQCHPGFTARPRAGGTVKPQLGSGLARESGGSNKRKPLLSKGLTGCFFGNSTKKTMSETRFVLTLGGPTPDTEHRWIAATVAVRAMDGQEEAEATSWLEHRGAWPARRRIDMADSARIACVGPNSRGPVVCDRRVASVSQSAWCAPVGGDLESLRRAGGSRRPPSRKSTLPRLQWDSAPPRDRRATSPHRLGWNHEPPTKPVSVDAPANRFGVDPPDQKLTSTPSPHNSCETEVPAPLSRLPWYTRIG